MQLIDALLAMFCQSNHVVATFGETSVALMLNGGRYYLFDSHARNDHGFTDPNGSSVLLQFDDFPALKAYLYIRYEDCMFEMTPFNVRFYTGSANDNLSSDSGPFEIRVNTTFTKSRF